MREVAEPGDGRGRWAGRRGGWEARRAGGEAGVGAGTGDEADGGAGTGGGREGAGNLYPFRPFSAIWVEISGRRHQESLPFSAVFRCLGRDFLPAAPGISTLFARFPPFG